MTYKYIVRQTEIEQIFIDKNQKNPECWTYYQDEKGYYFIEGAAQKKRYSELKACLHCNRFFASRKLNAKLAVNCSQYCYLETRKKSCTVNCATCSAEIVRSTHSLKSSKHGKYFCNKICKDRGQMIEGGVPEIHPSHYKDGSSNYVRTAFKHLPNKCIDCNISFKSLLQVHHKDGDRKNSDIENLEILCLTHHSMRHMKYSDKRKCWEVDFRSLTPVVELEKLLKLSTK